MTGTTPWQRTLGKRSVRPSGQGVLVAVRVCGAPLERRLREVSVAERPGATVRARSGASVNGALRERPSAVVRVALPSSRTVITTSLWAMPPRRS